MELVEFRLWPLATFRQDAEYGRHLAIADTARFAAGLTRSQMTQLRHPARVSALSAPSILAHDWRR